MRSETSTGQWLGTPLSPACERAHVLITRHIDGELARKDAKDLRSHLLSCNACRRTLESQAAQSQMVAESLKALWADGLDKKKEISGRELWLKLRHALPRIAACAAFTACVFIFAIKATAPSGSSDTARVTIAPSKPVRDTIAAQHQPVISAEPRIDLPVSPAENIPSSDDLLDDAADAVPEAVAVEIKSPSARVPETPPARAQSIASRVEQTLAELQPPAIPFKPLAGVALTYSILTEAGAKEEGCVTILGDVLRGKAVIHIETSDKKVFEAAQADVDTIVPESRRAVIRKLLNECLEPAHRKRIEESIRKLGE